MKNIEKMNEAELRKYILDLKKMMLSIQRSNMECEKDRRRLEWLDHAKSAEYKEGPCAWSINGMEPEHHCLRDAIDSVMKQYATNKQKP